MITICDITLPYRSDEWHICLDDDGDVYTSIYAAGTCASFLVGDVTEKSLAEWITTVDFAAVLAAVLAAILPARNAVNAAINDARRGPRGLVVHQDAAERPRRPGDDGCAS